MPNLRFERKPQQVFLLLTILVFMTTFAFAVRSALVGSKSVAVGWAALFMVFGYGLLVKARGERWFRGVLVIPAGVILALTTALPIGYMLYTSFFDVELLTFNSDWNFVGLKNYVDLLFHDELLWVIMFRTLEFVIFSVGLQITLGLALALMISNEFPGKKLLQMVLVLPVLTTPVVVAMLWKYMLDYNTGLLNQILEVMRLTPQPWLSNEGLPFIQAIPFVGSWMVKYLNMTYGFLSLIMVTVWQWTPFSFLVFYAGLSSLPSEPFEAAEVDGASWWQTFRYLTFPLMRPLIVVVVLIRMIDLLKLYAPIWVLFGNAVNMRVLNIHLYTLGLVTHEYSRTSALGMISLLIVLALSLAMGKWMSEGSKA